MTQNKYKRSEGRFKGADGNDLFFQIWDNPKARGTIVITHGHGEHSEAYHRLVDAFSQDEWSFWGWDLRGHGRSEGARGYAASFDDYCRDYVELLKLLKTQDKINKGPLVLLCHSMGATIEFKTLLQHPEFTPDALVVSGPLFGLSMEVPQFKKSAATWLNKLVPKLTLGNEISNGDLTRDPEVIREYEQDPFRHLRISAGVYLGFMESFPYILEHAGEIKTKTLFQISDKDPVISSPEAMKVFNALGSADKELKIYPEAKHEIYNDIIRDQAFDDLKKFLQTVVKK